MIFPLDWSSDVHGIFILLNDTVITCITFEIHSKHAIKDRI